MCPQGEGCWNDLYLQYEGLLEIKMPHLYKFFEIKSVLDKKKISANSKKGLVKSGNSQNVLG